MKIRLVEAIPLRIAFRRTFSFGNIDRNESHNVIVRVKTDDGLTGYGEACPVAAFTRETPHAIVQLFHKLEDFLIDANPLDRKPLLKALDPHLRGYPFTRAAIDFALCDIVGKALEIPISTILGGRFRDRVEVHGSVGWASPASMAAIAVEQMRLGVTTLKLYVGRDEFAGDLGRLEAVRTAVGPDVPFLVDVNGRWDIPTLTRALPVLQDLGVVGLEQPLPPGQDADVAEQLRETGIDVIADESVFGPDDVVRLSRLRAAHVVNLGVSKIGGLLKAEECAAVAQAVGLGIVVGSVLELGIATAAGLHLAASIEAPRYPSYLVGPLKYQHQITSPALSVCDGTVEVPTGPGLGIDVDDRLLDDLRAP